MRQALHLLKATGLLSLIILFSAQTFAQTATPPSAGDGTESNPYEIANLENLYWLSQSDTAWDKHYIQTVDIDAAPTSGWDSDSGFTPIGNNNTEFSGTYNGQHHKIDSLYINRESDKNIGLFGLVKGNSAQIENLGVTNVDITGKKNIGSIVGENYGTINKCSATGNVNSSNLVEHTNTGGLVGFNKDTIKSSFSKVDVFSEENCIGGIVGYMNDESGLIINCYSKGKISGALYKGGIIGKCRNGSIKNCYSNSYFDTTFFAYIGGIVGDNTYGTIQSSFWDTETSGLNDSDGGTGKTTPEMRSPWTYINEGWDFMNETNNGEEDVWGINPNENGGYPFLSWQGFAYQTPLVITTEEVTNIDTISATGNIKILAEGTSEITAHGICWDTTATPTLEGNHTDEGSVSDTGTFASNITGLKKSTKYYLRAYATNSDTTIYGNEVTIITFPSFSKPTGNGTEEDPYQISNLKNLAWLMGSDTAWGKHYVQTADIDASATKNWYSGKGFIPIGNSTTKFTGTYNGQRHKIDSLYINRGSENNIGLFGITGSSKIVKLTLINVNITGKKHVGSIVGNNKGTINQCSATGDVNSNADFSEIGGLAGSNDSTIKKSFSKVNVTSEGDYVGGITGRNDHSGLIINCYSHGKISGVVNIGGIVGHNYFGNIKYCYSTSPVNGIWDIGGIVGYNSYGTTQNSFWDTETSGLNHSDGGTGKTTPEMRSPLTYINEGWDFMNETNNGEDDYWGINPNENDEYPFLSWQGFAYQTPFKIKTQQATNIDSTSATGIIKILAEGTSEITAHGICWDTTATPTLEGNHTDEGSVSDTGTFASNITGLKKSTTYHLRAYATNSDTTIYGNEVTIVTFPSFSKPTGNGTEENPYQIANLENLAWLMASDTAWDKHFIQTANIDASSTNNWYSGKGFIPIGKGTTKFTGTYNGQHHKIDSLYINRGSEDYIGLFGYLKGNSAKIEKVYIENVDITGKESVGGLVGYNEGDIKECAVIGKVEGKGSPFYMTGGLAGVNRDTIKSCFTKVNAAANSQVGGIVGNLNDGGYIKNCYSRGQISGNNDLGGIAGRNYKGKIKYCYSTSPVNYSHYSSGGIVGYNSYGTTQNSFWDTETSGQNSSAGGGTGLSTSEMQNLYNYDNADWNFVNIWGFNPAENDGYPFLRWEGFSNDISVLIVETTEVDDIDVSSASIRGFLIGLGNSNPTAYGVCWNKTGTPTINNDTTSLGSTDTTGSFMTHLSDLEANTTYFVRTYATNNDTTVYGDEFSFTTLTYELEVGGNFYADDKIYDGTTHLDSVENNLYLSGIVGDDDVKIDTLITQFNDSIAGEDKVVKITNLSLSGNDTAKYHVSMDDLPVDSADIHPKELIVKDAKVNDKVYDGTTDANITGGSLNGIISGDNVTLDDRSGSFASADAGSNIEVISKMTIKGENAMNYKITQPKYLTGDIIPKETALEGSFKVENKEYDGTKKATISENNLKLEGIIANDQVSLANVNASFAQVEEGTDITVTIDTAELEGADTANYCLSLTDAPTTTADITETTGINYADKAGIKLYPNPFQDYIMIESEREIKKVEIASMSGITRIIENPEKRISTAKLEEGFYLIILEDTQGNRYQEKIIKK